MACKKCKQKNDGSFNPSNQEILNNITGITRFVKIVMVVWTLLAAYGVYAIIRDFL